MAGARLALVYWLNNTGPCLGSCGVISDPLASLFLSSLRSIYRLLKRSFFKRTNLAWQGTTYLARFGAQRARA